MGEMGLGRPPPGGTNAGERDDLELERPDPKESTSGQSFQERLASGVGSHGYHFPVDLVYWVISFAAGGSDPGPGGRVDRVPGGVEGDRGAGVPQEPHQVLTQGSGCEPRDRAPRRRPEARGGD